MMRSHLAGLAALALVLAAAAPAAAQRMAPASTARTPQGKPDLNGVWFTRGYQPTVMTVQGTLPPFQPWAARRYQESLSAQEAGKPLPNSSALCLPQGIPRLMYAPYPFEILQKPRQITFLHEVNHLVRQIYMDEPQPAEAPDLTYLGHSVGRWDGDVLVVDTIALNDLTLIDRAGIPHSAALHVIERYKLIVGGRRLEATITVDDPKAFTKPWDMRIAFDKRPDVRLMEYVCAEHNRNGGRSEATSAGAPAASPPLAPPPSRRNSRARRW
jgi:hypothetical protein